MHSGFGMHKHVELLIGRLATDAVLRRRFALCPDHVLLEQGLELNAVELAALSRLDADALDAFAATLDQRLRKARTTPVEPRGDEAIEP